MTGKNGIQVGDRTDPVAVTELSLGMTIGSPFRGGSIFRLPAWICVATAMIFLSGPSPTVAQTLPPGFVDAATVVPGLVVEMRYAGEHNFVGAPVAGYEKPICILTKEAAAALAKAQIALVSSGVGLKVFDCYRPARAVAHFLRWSRDLRDTKTKGEFYPDTDKRDLFRDGYISQRSGHSRGSTVDLTLVDILPGPDGKLRERDMGTSFDFFSSFSSPSDTRVSEEARSNRRLLSDAMRKNGFIPYGKEWWHFTLAHEPFPQTYFDFVVK